jgi:hypothetical protein
MVVAMATSNSALERISHAEKGKYWVRLKRVRESR